MLISALIGFLMGVLAAVVFIAIAVSLVHQNTEGHL